MESKNKSVLIGYAVDPSLPMISKEQAMQMTHLYIAFGVIKNGEVDVGGLKNLDCIANIRQFNPELKIVLSIGGWGVDGFSDAASTPSNRALFAKSAVGILKTYRLDGLDIDWEYPCYSQGEIKSSRADKENFTLLLADTHAQLALQGAADNRHYLLTIAVGADRFFVDGTNMREAQQFLDLVLIMTYDMRGSFQASTGHHANLFTSTGDLFRVSADTSIKMFMEAGVPREKIVMGAAFYSRQWTGVPDVNNGLHQMTRSADERKPGALVRYIAKLTDLLSLQRRPQPPHGSAIPPTFRSVGGIGPMYGALIEHYVDKNGYRRHWDDEAKAPYLFNGNTFITYDDEESLHHKCQYVRDNGLAGMMFWAYAFDGPSHRLLGALHAGLAGQN